MVSLTGTLRKRLATGLAAQGYAQLVTILIQLGTVPVLLASWGAERYGVWLIIAAVPTFLSLVDFGFAQAGASEMTMRIAAGEQDQAKTSYDSVLALNCLFGSIGASAMAGFALSPLSAALLGPTYDAEARVALLVLCGNAFLTLLLGVLNAGLRSVGQLAIGVWLAASIRLAEALAMMAVAWDGGNLLDAALAMLTVRALATVAIVWSIQRRWPWLRPGFGHARLDALKRMLAPSLHFAGYVVGSLINIQGSTIVIGATLGPSAVALTSTARTLARVGTTAANMLNSTLQPEYAAFFGRVERAKFRHLLRHHAAAIVLVTTCYLVAMLGLGPRVYALWTHHSVFLPPLLFTLLVIAAAGEMVWTALQTPTIAVNRMRLIGASYLVANGLGLTAIAFFASRMGVMVFGWSCLVIALAMIVVAMREQHNLWRILADTPASGDAPPR